MGNASARTVNEMAYNNMSTIFQKQNGFLTFIWAAKHLQTRLAGNKEGR